MGTRSPGNPPFDPFWARAPEAKVPITSHIGNSGYDRIYSWWMGQQSEFVAFQTDPAQGCLDMMGRASADMLTYMVCHGVFDRHPGLRVAVVESGSAWVCPMLDRMANTYGRMPQYFKKDPVDTVRQHVSIMPFYKDSARELIDLMGLENLTFGSDWPHPEGLGDPLDYYVDIADMCPAEQKMVMGDNLKDLLEGRW